MPVELALTDCSRRVFASVCEPADGRFKSLANGRWKQRSAVGTGRMIVDQFARPAHEESLRALEFILKAWEGGTDEDIPPELIAYAAMFTALIELIVTFGEENVARLAEGLVKRIRNGEFSVPAQMH